MVPVNLRVNEQDATLYDVRHQQTRSPPELLDDEPVFFGAFLVNQLYQLVSANPR
jgi:hypothetical protein